MPIGPRPEPPPVPRKEPRSWRPEHYPNHLAYQTPQRPPKVPLTSELITQDYESSSIDQQSISPVSFSSASFISNSANSSPTSPNRLKGPRPLSSPPMKPPKSRIPYPVEPQQHLPSPMQHNPPSPFDDPSDIFPSPSERNILSMPEPVSDNDFSIPSPGYHSLNLSPNHKTNGGTTNDAEPTPTLSLVPPPLNDTNDYSRPTRSIFQWGIPAELLPPMPVPVDAMSGLHMGSKGQYTMNLDLPQIPPMDPVRPKFSVEQLTVSDFRTPNDLWSIFALAKWLYELVMSYDAEITVEDAQQALVRLFLYRVNTLQWNKAEKIAFSVICSLKKQRFIEDSVEQLVLKTSGPEVSGVLTIFTGYENGCYSPSKSSYPENTCCYSSTCLREPRSKRQGQLHLHRETSQIPRNNSSRTAKSFNTLGNAPNRSRSNTAVSKISTTTTMFDENHTEHLAAGDAIKETDAEYAEESGNATLTPISEEGLLMVNQLDPSVTLEMNWRKYWNIDENDAKEVDPGIVKLQFAIHEIIMSEVLYVRDLQIYVAVYGEIELLEGLSVMSNQAEYSTRVFERIRGVLATNEMLLARLLDRQQEQGPYVQEIADLVREWALEPETIDAYMRYADDYLWADHHLRRELAQSPRLQKWMEERAKDQRLTGRPHSFFFNRVLPRVARYHLLLGAVLKYTQKVGPDAECHIIEQAIQACNNLTQRCDDCVAKQKRVLDVQNLKAHIVFKSSAVTADLKLGDKRRRLIRRGDMLRRGDLKMDWVETHTLLLDNFFVLSKTREGMNGTAFYVTKAPIPLDLLVLESCEEEGVVRVSSRIAFTRHGPVEEPDPSSAESERTPVMYPLRITHLGSGGQKYQMFVPTRPERTHWAQSIIEAKQSRAQLAFTRSAEPFRLEKIADQFAYPESEKPQLPVPIPDTPLHRAVGRVDPDDMSRVALRRKVNCIATVGSLYLVGTDNGLWVGTNVMNSDSADTENADTNENVWSCVFTNPQRIIKLEILDTMNAIFILCGDHNLTWYPLDQLVSRGLGDTRRTIGIRLNRTRKVVDFNIAYHRGRVAVMYLQQGGTLKVVEPIRSHGALSMRSLAHVGLTPASSCIDGFREVDRMQVGADTTRITTFLKSIILTTIKSFEWATLDSKRPVKIPSGTNPKESQYWGRPIRVIKLDAARVLMCYEACYVICNISGNVGIQPTTWFLEKCVECAYYAPYLILISQGGEMIEIRYVDEFPGRLVQIITGKDIKLLSNGDETVYIRIAHPWAPGRQLILQLVGNETIRDSESTWQSSSM